MDSDEDTLIRRAQTDLEAFEELYHRYLNRLYAYVSTRTRTEDDVADLMQQIMVEALQSLPRYRGDSRTFPAWLFRIARNTVIDSYRRRRATISLHRISDAAKPRREESLDEGIVHDGKLTRLRAVVETLSDDRQELLALRFGAQLTVAEIAAIVGKSEAATQRQLHRLIGTLRELYDDDTQ